MKKEYKDHVTELALAVVYKLTLKSRDNKEYFTPQTICDRMPMTHCHVTGQDVDSVLDEKTNEGYVSKVVLMAGEDLRPRYVGYRANLEKSKELEVIVEINSSILRRDL